MKSKGDLISREALKEEFKRSANSVRNWKEDALNNGNDESAIRADAVLAYLTEVKGIIDNAPTVEPFEPDYVGAERLKARQRGYEEGYHNGMRMGKTLNPQIKQGEWKNHRNDHGHNIADCSLCGKTMQWHDEDGDGVPRYCWYCGAEMRRGGAE